MRKPLTKSHVAGEWGAMPLLDPGLVKSYLWGLPEDEIRHFIRGLPGGRELELHLPGSYASPAMLASEAAELLGRRGLIGEALIRLMDRQRTAQETAPSAAPPHLQHATTKIEHLLDRASLILPARVADEEFGDALEDIHRRIERGCPAWTIYLRAISAAFWATWNAIKGWRPARDKRGA